MLIWRARQDSNLWPLAPESNLGLPNYLDGLRKAL